LVFEISFTWNIPESCSFCLDLSLFSITLVISCSQGRITCYKEPVSLVVVNLLILRHNAILILPWLQDITRIFYISWVFQFPSCTKAPWLLINRLLGYFPDPWSLKVLVRVGNFDFLFGHWLPHSIRKQLQDVKQNVEESIEELTERV
jgi:hypothetical protein